MRLREDREGFHSGKVACCGREMKMVAGRGLPLMRSQAEAHRDANRGGGRGSPGSPGGLVSQRSLPLCPGGADRPVLSLSTDPGPGVDCRLGARQGRVQGTFQLWNKMSGG